MKKNINIQEEWNTLGANFSVQIGIPQFSIPKNYFDNLPNEIIGGIKSFDVSEPTLPSIAIPYNTPSNYFDQLCTQVINSINEVEALIQQNIVPELSKQNIFEVPSGYFEAFAENVWVNINAEISVEAELEESPLLASLRGINPFEKHMDIIIPVPEFVKKKAEKWDVPMVIGKRLRLSNIAMAASVAIFFVLGAAWLHISQKESAINNVAISAFTPQDKASQLLSEIPNTEIEKYIDQNIEEFNEFALESNMASSKINTTQSLEKALDNVSNEDIEAYLRGDI
ncbi:MAG TPA: hypothetical protein VLZ83_03580 [Edaphocola sp.]|nr:hypothetical protein [Edaphocola sp.]